MFTNVLSNKVPMVIFPPNNAPEVIIQSNNTSTIITLLSEAHATAIQSNDKQINIVHLNDMPAAPSSCTSSSSDTRHHHPTQHEGPSPRWEGVIHLYDNHGYPTSRTHPGFRGSYASQNHAGQHQQASEGGPAPIQELKPQRQLDYVQTSVNAIDAPLSIAIKHLCQAKYLSAMMLCWALQAHTRKEPNLHLPQQGAHMPHIFIHSWIKWVRISSCMQQWRAYTHCCKGNTSPKFSATSQCLPGFTATILTSWRENPLCLQPGWCRSSASTTTGSSLVCACSR